MNENMIRVLQRGLDYKSFVWYRPQQRSHHESNSLVFKWKLKFSSLLLILYPIEISTSVKTIKIWFLSTSLCNPVELIWPVLQQIRGGPMYSCQICDAHSPCSTPLSSWSAVGYWTSSQNKHNLRENIDEEEWKEKEQNGKRKRKCQSAFQGHPKCSGWFLAGPRYDSMISQQEKCNADIHQMLVQLRFISYGEDPAVVGRSDWMRRRHTQTTNLALHTFHSDCSLVFPHAFFVLWLRSTPHHPPPRVRCCCCCCLHARCVCICVGVCVSERPQKLQHACLTLLCIQACMCACGSACVRFLAWLQAHWKA